jgi:hypothetical protein
MDKLKEKLHIGSSRKSQSEDTYDSSNVGTIEGM